MTETNMISDIGRLGLVVGGRSGGIIEGVRGEKVKTQTVQ